MPEYKGSLKGRHFLSLRDYSSKDINCILDLARELKEKQQQGIPHRLLGDKILAMIFQKASTRTRVSFEVGMWQLGGSALFLSSQDLQIGRGEPVKDTARVLSRYADGIMIRTFEHEEVEEMSRHASVPVINGLTDSFHPCQALADLLTIKEKKGHLEGIKLAYLGDGNNVANSLLLGCARMGMHIVAACPTHYRPSEQVVSTAVEAAGRSGGMVEITADPEEAVKGAGVLYTDVWASMGREREALERIKALEPFQVNQGLVDLAAPDAIIMHCLPAHRGEEITEEVMESAASVVFDQAENRLHAQKALMALIM